MHSGSEPTPLSVSLLALPETTPATLYSLHEVFASVGVTWSALTGERPDAPRMEARIVAREAAPFASLIGPPIAPHSALPREASDIVVVSDIAIAPEDDPRGRWQAEAEWVREQFARGAVVCSVCTGSLLLAEAGLLDGLEATTHWSAAEIFRAHYPAVRLRPERVLSLAGPEQRIVTGGGASSWEDVALHLIARFCGHPEAVRIAKIFVFGDRSEGQLPFSAMGRPRAHGDAVIAACQEWIADHYAAPNPVARMAAHSGLAERTFKRRFTAATGYTPVDYVQALRIEEAKQLLERTDEPTDAVAGLVGYEDPAFFRRLFKRRTGITPARYRQRFKKIAVAAQPPGTRACTQRPAERPAP